MNLELNHCISFNQKNYIR